MLRAEREILRKSRGLLRAGERDPLSAYRFIAAERANHPVSLLGASLGVSRSGFHAWPRRPHPARAGADARLGARIAAIHAAGRGT